jgi:hypothetical protein
MAMIAFAFPSVSSSQKSEAGKKESTDRPLNQACPLSVTPSSSSSLDCRFGDVRTAEVALVT